MRGPEASEVLLKIRQAGLRYIYSCPAPPSDAVKPLAASLALESTANARFSLA